MIQTTTGSFFPLYQFLRTSAPTSLLKTEISSNSAMLSPPQISSLTMSPHLGSPPTRNLPLLKLKSLRVNAIMTLFSKSRLRTARRTRTSAPWPASSSSFTTHPKSPCGRTPNLSRIGATSSRRSTGTRILHNHPTSGSSRKFPPSPRQTPATRRRPKRSSLCLSSENTSSFNALCSTTTTH